MRHYRPLNEGLVGTLTLDGSLRVIGENLVDTVVSAMKKYIDEHNEVTLERREMAGSVLIKSLPRVLVEMILEYIHEPLSDPVMNESASKRLGYAVE